MKYVATFLVMLSISMFSIGCKKTEVTPAVTPTPKTDVTPKVEPTPKVDDTAPKT